jgi:hypothetical protein
MAGADDVGVEVAQLLERGYDLTKLGRHFMLVAQCDAHPFALAVERRQLDIERGGEQLLEEALEELMTLLDRPTARPGVIVPSAIPAAYSSRRSNSPGSI